MKTNLTSSKTAGAKATGATKINGKAHSGNAERMKRPETTNETGKTLPPVRTLASAKWIYQQVLERYKAGVLKDINAPDIMPTGDATQQLLQWKLVFAETAAINTNLEPGSYFGAMPEDHSWMGNQTNGELQILDYLHDVLFKTGVNAPKSPVTAQQAESQVNDYPEEKAPAEAPFRTITAEQAKSLYHAVLEAYITEARANLKTADEDHNPKTAEQVYKMEFNIGCLLRSHLELTPAEMTDLLPSNTNDPIDERIPEIDAARTLFFMDHLHRILFRSGEQHRDEQILQE